MTQEVDEPYRQAAARLEVTDRVQQVLAGAMTIDNYSWNERGILLVRGRLLAPADTLYRRIRAGLEPIGFTPFLRPGAQGDELVALPMIIGKAPVRYGLPLLLFVLTVLSSMITGALHDWSGQINSATDLWNAIITILTTPALLLTGLPFAATLLGILGTHEFGHYIVGRWRGAPVSLPYFIPVPPGIGFTGTLGAVIVQREPLEDRRTTLEVGIAGPIAGLIVAIPLLFYGLATSPLGTPTAAMLAQGYLQEGNSLLYIAAKWLVFGQILPGPSGLDVQLNSVAWGAWIGLLVTMLNLLPVGQLDGGHIAYALLGPQARYLGYGVLVGCAILGLGLPENYSWLVWGMLGLLMGARHPEPLNSISDIKGGYIGLAIFGLALFLLLFMPIPLRAIGGGS